MNVTVSAISIAVLLAALLTAPQLSLLWGEVHRLNAASIAPAHPPRKRKPPDSAG